MANFDRCIALPSEAEPSASTPRRSHYPVPCLAGERSPGRCLHTLRATRDLEDARPRLRRGAALGVVRERRTLAIQGRHQLAGQPVGDVLNGSTAMTTLRLSRIALVIAVAFFFTLVAFGNITDYGANWKFVTHVMSMDTTFQDPDLMWRAVTDPTLQHAAYGTIITWQVLTALVLWIGVIRLARAAAGDREVFAAGARRRHRRAHHGAAALRHRLSGRRRRVVRDVAVAHLERAGDGGDLRIVHRAGAPASMRTGAGTTVVMRIGAPLLAPRASRGCLITIA